MFIQVSNLFYCRICFSFLPLHILNCNYETYCLNWFIKRMPNNSKLVFENSIISISKKKKKKKSQNLPFFAIVLNPAFIRSETSDDDFQKHKFTLLSLDPHTCL